MTLPGSARQPRGCVADNHRPQKHSAQLRLRTACGTLARTAPVGCGSCSRRHHSCDDDDDDDHDDVLHGVKKDLLVGSPELSVPEFHQTTDF
ncbi:putative cytitidyltransferase [Anopheles sinensis]|uniref:Putative cytitidyltransferase n=1 Tax=Anopheles sinensis TaxID=74873 RepID=A0A084WJ16_ANOSI|nr:putative cytitidyltransferase [Anopheles sinensis]